ncbi:hypothetical protein DRQ32_06995 [bacterium]|nr:MAG: hypothetical protein DRQ32_06995 [bacterium]RLA50336.1 MAG: hypothetical protein DRQ65_09105 [Gammaproteobacteria bacterium]
MTRPHHNARRSKKAWRAIFARYDVSGQSQRDFCKAEGIALSTFLRWRSDLRPGVASPPAATKHDSAPAGPPFVELIAPTPAQPWTIELELPGGCVLRVRP